MEMKVIISGTIRGIVNSANEKKVLKEDIVTLTKSSDQYMLVYYK